MDDKFDDINKILERETLIREKLQELEKIFNLGNCLFNSTYAI